MVYVCELGMGQRVYVENQGTQTIVTLASSGPGQQQQSSSGFQTGTWAQPPEVFQMPYGKLLKITTTAGDSFIQLQGNSISVISGSPSLEGFQQLHMQQGSSSSMPSMASMEPMKPMEPMKMGNMQMNMNPMEMRMGDMEMRMGTPPSSSTAASSTDTSNIRQFCSQCGSAVKPSDRFCSSCGNQLD